MTMRWRPGLVLNTCAAARPSFKAVSLVIGSTLATPLIPSVPKSRCITASFPCVPLACEDYDALNEYRRSEEHTSELQSRLHLVCRLLLEKKKKDKQYR